MYVLNRPMLDNYADSFMTLPKLQKGITEYNLVSTCKIPLTSLSKPLCGSNGVFCMDLISRFVVTAGRGYRGYVRYMYMGCHTDGGFLT